MSKKTSLSKKNILQQNKTTQKAEKKSINTWVWVALAIVLLTTLAIYFKAIKFDFLMTWDDSFYFTENNDIKDLHWTNIKLFFTEFYLGNYQPITVLMYAIEYKLVGNSSYLYHLNNIILHIINTFLVFVLIRKISSKNVMVALITASFFAIHPMHVESVVWVSERKDVLYSFFFLLSLIIYTNYYKSGKLKHLILTCIFFVLSCLTKSAAVILPLVLLLLDYYSNRKYSWKMFVEKVPFFAISLIFGIVALNSQKSAIPATPIISNHFLVVSFSLISYIFKAFIPVHLSAIYPYPIESGGTLPIMYYLSLLFIGLLILFVWYSCRWGKDVVFGFLFFIITIILVLQFVEVGFATMADRYTYIPYIGLFFIVGKFFEYLYNSVNRNYKKYTNYLLVAIIFGFITFSTISYGRVKLWKNDGALFSDVLNKYPDCVGALNNRGVYYINNVQIESSYNNVQVVSIGGNIEKGKLYINNAINDFNRIIALYGNYLFVYRYRGFARYLSNDYTGAINDFGQAITINPKDEVAYFNRGNSKIALKDYNGAIKDFDEAIAINSKDINFYFNRGNAKKEIKDYIGAIKDFDKTIELNPLHISAYNNRSLLKCILKDYKGAIADFDKMIELNPQDSATIKNRNVVQSLLENLKE